MADHGIINNNRPVLDRGFELTGTVARGAMSLVRGFGNAVVRGTRRLQYSRMLSVLNEASDAQLKSIGITRADIPRHAAYLIDYKYEGL